MLIFWMDDEPSFPLGGPWAEAFNQALPNTNVQLEVIVVSDDDLRCIEAKFDDARTRLGTPNLVLMDHNLARADLGFQASGSSLSHMIRTQHPAIAVACLTAEATDLEGLDFEQKSEYVAVYTKDGLQNNLEEIVVLARDYRKLCNEDGRILGREAILNLLQAPPPDKEHLDYVLPPEFSKAPAGEGNAPLQTPHMLARWILGGLLSRPGYIVDADEVSTMLGLRIGSEHLWSELLTNARYRGVFATDSSPKWWMSQLAQKVFEASKDPDAPSLQLAGRRLPGITEEDYSRSDFGSASDPPPDCLAFTDVKMGKRIQTYRSQTREFFGRRGSLPGFSPYLIATRPRRDS